jgi:tetratricopeptide (TPR) repeat protein
VSDTPSENKENKTEESDQVDFNKVTSSNEQQPPAPSTPAPSAPNKETNQKIGILIVEEKTDLQSFYSNALSKTGFYDIQICPNAREALIYLEEHHEKIHFVIFDWVMTEITGSIFTQKIRSENRFHHLEMIVSTADVDKEDQFLMVELDIHYVIPKITNANEFVSKINEIKEKYLASYALFSKLKDLQTLLNDIQIEKCEELLKLPEIEKEITTNPRFIHLGGEVRITQKKYEEAVEFIKKFLEDHKNEFGAENLKSLSTLGKALCLSNKFDDALAIFTLLESKSPKNLAHKIMAGDALLGLDNIEEAEGKYQEVLEKDPNNKEAMVGMGKANAVAGNMDAANSFFSKVEGSFESRYLASFFNNRGVAMVRKGELQNAITFYENALQFLDKFKGQVYFNLGMAYYRMGNLTDAVKAFKAALNSKEAAQLKNKTIIKEIEEKGMDKFIADHQKQQK